nr:hypothetical protein [Xanthomonadaceae bacterium]
MVAIFFHPDCGARGRPRARTVGSGFGPDLLTSRVAGALAGSRGPAIPGPRLPPVGNSTPP